MSEKTYKRAIDLAEHYVAIGQTEIYLYDRDEEIPSELWALVYSAEEGGSWRLNGPAGVRFHANHPSGLTFKWTVDFESPDANGSGVSQFDREKLRDVIMKLPADGVKSFARMLEHSVLPPLKQRTEELRAAMNKQIDSYDCALGLVAYAKEIAGK